MRDHSMTIPELPALDPGITLLESGNRGLKPFQSLVCDHVLLNAGNAYWVDSRGHARTCGLLQLVPDSHVLSRIHVARGFTPFQHHAIINALQTCDLENASLVVVPAVDAFYREDPLDRSQGQEMLVRGLAVIAGLSRRHNLPVLVTRTREDRFSTPVENIASEVVTVRETPVGPRFEGTEFETLVYPTGGDMVQTTLAFWKQVLQARAPLHEAARPGREEVPLHG